MSSDYRSGPMEVFRMARGELLGPVDSGWPDASNPGKTLQYWHKTPSNVEDARITQARAQHVDKGWALVFILRARDSNGELIYKESELEMIKTQFPDVYGVCSSFEEQCEALAAKVSDEALGNSSATTDTSETP